MSQAWAKKFYNSKEWRALRARLIVEAHFLCAHCGENYLKDSAQLVGHHIKELTPANIQDVNISLNPANIEIICRRCHDKEHRRFEFGNERNVYIVYGSPCSGKKAYVNQVSQHGDLIVDLDAIYQAISGCQSHYHPNGLKKVAFAVRDTLLEQVRMRVGFWHDAYIIGGYPRKLQREQLAAKLGAELIYMETTREEAKLAALASRGTQGQEWCTYIDRWFDSFEA